MRYDLIFSSSNYFSTKYSTNMKKTTPKNCRKFLPPLGGGDLTLVSKNLSYFLQITTGEMNKAPQAKTFVIETIFTPKIAQKYKKMANIKFTPPERGGRFWN